MPCRVDPTPEEIRRSVEATQKREKDISNTISNLASMLCTMCKIHIDQKLPIPTPIHDWYIKHQKEDKQRLLKAKASAIAKLTDDEKEALGLL